MLAQKLFYFSRQMRRIITKRSYTIYVNNTSKLTSVLIINNTLLLLINKKIHFFILDLISPG